MPPLPKISHDQIRGAVQRSGYLVEYRIEQVLGRYGYSVQANQAYPDPITRKSRELDVTAIAGVGITSDWLNSIWSRLLIECVNNPQPIGFFTKTPETPTTHIFDLKCSGVPVKIKKGKEWTKLSDFLDMQRYHHHCKGKIATQYCSFTAKKGTNPIEWLAQHEDTHFGSFDKLCFALDHEINQHYAHTRLRVKETVNVQMYYLILVASGELVEIMPARKEVKLRAANHIHYVQSYITNGREQIYHIDVVTEKYLRRLLNIIDDELQKTVRLFRRRKEIIQQSVDQITTSVKGLRSPDAIRSRVEYRGPWGTHDPS
jgi:hypothetical protein